jgi:DNA gyrase subunit A
LEGLIGITSKIDAVIKLIREADNREIALQGLIDGGYVVSPEQADAVLKITLGNLTKLDTRAMNDEFDKLTKRSAWLTEQLASDKKMLKLISKEQLELAEKIGDDRRCEIIESAGTLSVEDLIPEENIIVSLTKDGYIKRVPTTTFKAQNRGGKGVIGVKSREEDEAADIFPGSTHDLFLFFTNQGNLLKKKGHEIPLATRTSKGMHLANLLNLNPDEKVSSTITLKTLDTDGYFIMTTKKGLVKRSEIRDYNSSLRKRGLKAITLTDGDELAVVQITNGNQDIMFVTGDGMAVRYNEEVVRSTGKNSQGCKAMLLAENDSIVAMMSFSPEENPSVLIITEQGFGKRTETAGYRSTSGRYVKGLKTINQVKKDRNGKIVAAAIVQDDDDFITLTSKGKMIRNRVADIKSKGRANMGITLVSLDAGDTVQTVKVVKTEPEEENVEEVE